MKNLIDIEKDVFQRLKADNCDSEVFVVFTSINTPKNTMPCGQHVITLFNCLQKSAGAIKRVGVPNVILAQSDDDLPQGVKCVVLDENVFHEQLTVKLEAITSKFDSPSVHNPFMLVNGKLASMYGPKKHIFKLNPAGHEELHDILKKAMGEFVQENSRKTFSTFQALVEGVIHSKYCCRCLQIILSNLKSLNHVAHFVSNISGGIRSPVCEKEMELCGDWVDDQGKSYKTKCWRYSEAMKSASAQKSTVPAKEISVEKLTAKLIDHDYLSNDKMEEHFPELSSTSESTKDEDELSIQKNIVISYAGSEESTQKEMFNAYATINDCLTKHKSKLPLKRWSDHLFCVFCFKFHSSPWHECEHWNEAEKRASKELCRLIEGKFTLDLDVFETLKKFVCDQLDRYGDVRKPAINESKTPNPNRAIRSGIPIKRKDTLKEKQTTKSQPKDEHFVAKTVKEEVSKPAVASRLAIRTGVPVKIKKQPVKKNESTKKAKTTTTKSKLNQGAVSHSSESKHLQEASLPKRSKESVGDKQIETQPLTNTSSNERKEQAGNEIVNYVPHTGYVSPLLPVDRSTWTREHHMMHLYGPSYQALRPFVPTFPIYQPNPAFHQGNFFYNNGFMGMHHVPNVYGYQPQSFQPNNSQVITLDDDDDMPVALN